MSDRFPESESTVGKAFKLLISVPSQRCGFQGPSTSEQCWLAGRDDPKAFVGTSLGVVVAAFKGV